MKAKIWLFATLVSLSGLALAQDKVTQSTDPAKISSIEEHAKALAANQPTQADMGMDHKMHKKWHKKSHKKMHKEMNKDMEKKAPEGDAPMMEKKG